MTIRAIALDSDNDGLSRVPFWAFGMGLTFFSGNAFSVGQLCSTFMVWSFSLEDFGMLTPMIVPLGVCGGGGGFACPCYTFCSLLTSVGVYCRKVLACFTLGLCYFWVGWIFANVLSLTWGCFLRRGSVSCRACNSTFLRKEPFCVSCAVRVLTFWRNIFPWVWQIFCSLFFAPIAPYWHLLVCLVERFGLLNIGVMLFLGRMGFLQICFPYLGIFSPAGVGILPGFNFIFFL